MRKILFSITVSLFTILSLSAQTGSIKGVVTDAKTKEPLIGAVVMLSKGTLIGAQTDIEGSYELTNVPTGKNTVRISFVSYQAKTVDVNIEAGKTTTLDIALAEEAQVIETVVVKTTRTTNTENAVMIETRKAEQVVVGISAAQISKSQDRDAAQVIRRVPGVTITEDRFVNIRGLSERYNAVMLNDAPTPSVDVDTRSFSFDLIPSSAIDRMLVFKSGAGDLPADMAGGTVKIYTKASADANTFAFGIGTGYRTDVTFQKADSYKGGKLDWLGFDDGSRGLPSGFPKISVLNVDDENAKAQFRKLPTFYDISSVNISPDVRVNMALTRVGNVGKKRFSNITAVNYSLTNAMPNNAILQRYEDQSSAQRTEYFQDRNFAQSARLGLMSNFTLAGEKSKIEFRNLFNQLGTKETLTRTGLKAIEGINVKSAGMRYEQRSIYSGQLAGTHTLNEKSKLTWVAGIGYTNRYEPDYRRFASNRTVASTEPTGVYTIEVPPVANPSLFQSARFWSNLWELSEFGSVAYETKLGLGADKSNEVKLKFGSTFEYKYRDFQARWFGYINPRSRQDLLKLTPEEFFNPDNISTAGLSMSEGTNADDKYNAQNMLATAFGTANFSLFGKLNTIIGLRGEYNRQQLSSFTRGAATKVSVDNPILRILPSLNMSYNISAKQLVRLAYSTTLNRPEFRELAPFSYVDWTNLNSISGNPNLKTASIQNLDLRYELYPSEGDMITVAAFYKHFTNPIEMVGRASGSGVSFTYANTKSAYAAGLEIELRKQLRGLTNSRFIDNLALVANTSLIYSRINTENLVGQITDRALQGQSPYLINAGLYFNDKELGLQANIMYNVIGPRIYTVGDLLGNQTIFEMPRNVLDFNITKELTKKIELRLGASDILNQTFRLIQDVDNTGTPSKGDEDWRSFKRGTYFTLGLNFKM